MACTSSMRALTSRQPSPVHSSAWQQGRLMTATSGFTVGKCANRRASAARSATDGDSDGRASPSSVASKPVVSNSRGLVQHEHSASGVFRTPGANITISEAYRYFMDTWDQAFTFDHEELPEGQWMEVVEGALPQDLCGTYFKTGPGRFQRGGEAYAHPYDGDGLVVSVAIKEGKAFFRSAFTRTTEYELEEKAQRVLFRGSFATQRSGGPLANFADLYVKNIVNTSVVAWGDKLLAMFEAALPYALDPTTLRTLHREDLGGRLKPGIVVDVGPLGNALLGLMQRAVSAPNRALPVQDTRGGGSAFTAHPHVDANSGRLCLWTYTMRPRGSDLDTVITFWELGADYKGGHLHTPGQAPAAAMSPSQATPALQSAAPQARQCPSAAGQSLAEPSTVQMASTATTTATRTGAAAASTSTSTGASTSLEVRASKEFVMQGYGFLHDFALTSNYYILIQPPVHTDIGPYFMGQVCAASSVRWRPKDPTLIHVIPRPGSDAEARGEGVRSIPVSPATFVFHHCNAYEDDTRPGVIVLDSVHYPSLPAIGKEALAEQHIDPDAGFYCRLRRMELDLNANTAVYVEPHAAGSTAAPSSSGSSTSDRDPRDPSTNAGMSASDATISYHDKYFEMPVINAACKGRRHRYIYGYSSIFNQASMGIMKVDMRHHRAQRWEPGEGYMCGEPMFVPRPDPKAEDDGYLVCTGFATSERRSEILVLDAQRINDGPIARLAVPRPVPHSLHGTWWPHFFCGPSA